jgi:hypothetical protein
VRWVAGADGVKGGLCVVGWNVDTEKWEVKFIPRMIEAIMLPEARDAKGLDIAMVLTAAAA